MYAQCIFLLLWDPPRSPGRVDSPRTYSLSHCRYAAAVHGMILTSGGEMVEMHQWEPWDPLNNIFTVAQRVVASYLISTSSNQIFALCTFFTEMHFFRNTVCYCRNMQTNSLASLEGDIQWCLHTCPISEQNAVIVKLILLNSIKVKLLLFTCNSSCHIIKNPTQWKLN